MLIAGVIIAVPVAASIWSYLPLYYHVSALLRVAGVEPRLVFATVDSQSRQNFKIYKQTQIEQDVDPLESTSCPIEPWGTDRIRKFLSLL